MSRDATVTMSRVPCITGTAPDAPATLVGFGPRGSPRRVSQLLAQPWSSSDICDSPRRDLGVPRRVVRPRRSVPTVAQELLAAFVHPMKEERDEHRDDTDTPDELCADQLVRRHRDASHDHTTTARVDSSATATTTTTAWRAITGRDAAPRRARWLEQFDETWREPCPGERAAASCSSRHAHLERRGDHRDHDGRGSARLRSGTGARVIAS